MDKILRGEISGKLLSTLESRWRFVRQQLLVTYLYQRFMHPIKAGITYEK